MIDVWDLNAKALIAFSLMMIVGLLIYIAFFKKETKKDRSSGGSSRR